MTVCFWVIKILYRKCNKWYLLVILPFLHVCFYFNRVLPECQQPQSLQQQLPQTPQHTSATTIQGGVPLVNSTPTPQITPTVHTTSTPVRQHTLQQSPAHSKAKVSCTPTHTSTVGSALPVPKNLNSTDFCNSTTNISTTNTGGLPIR